MVKTKTRAHIHCLGNHLVVLYVINYLMRTISTKLTHIVPHTYNLVDGFRLRLIVNSVNKIEKGNNTKPTPFMSAKAGKAIETVKPTMLELHATCTKWNFYVAFQTPGVGYFFRSVLCPELASVRKQSSILLSTNVVELNICAYHLMFIQNQLTDCHRFICWKFSHKIIKNHRRKTAAMCQKLNQMRNENKMYDNVLKVSSIFPMQVPNIDPIAHLYQSLATNGNVQPPREGSTG